MADTARTRAQLATIFADGQLDGAINEQDMRDLVKSVPVYGADGKVDPADLRGSVINAQTGTSYSLADTDNGATVTCANAAAVTVTIPKGLAAGFRCRVIQLGAGQVGFSAATDVTLHNAATQSKVSGQYGVVELTAYATDSYILSGSTGA